VVIYINLNLVHRLIDITHLKTPGIENVMISISTSRNKHFTILGLYKHPYTSIIHFKNYLHTLLQNITYPNPIIIAGDFNIDLNKYDTDLTTKNYFDDLLSHNLYQVINNSTRITHTSKSIIDHFYINPTKNWKLLTGMLTEPISDHLITFISLKGNNSIL